MFKKTNSGTFLITLIFFLLILCPLAIGKIIYVDDNATGGNDGSSWENAYTYLQDALASAKGYLTVDANDPEKHALSLSNGPVEIRVAQGIYKPDKGANQTPGDREATFQLINNVTLAGGYAGLNEPDPYMIDNRLYKTILSGDLNSDDIDVSDLSDLTNEPTRAENSYNVVTGSGTDETAVIDGFIITCGNANGPLTPAPIGEGIYNNLSKPTLSNSTIPTYQEKIIYGGGMYNEGNSSRITNCTFVNNSASSSGGGIYNSVSFSKLTNCTFSNNSAGYRDGPQGSGGGICNEGGEPIFTNCTFTKNQAEHWGGGLSNGYESSSTLINCAFSNNTARSGGGMCNGYKSTPTLTDCTFNGNWSGSGGGMYNDPDSNPMLTKCTFIGNCASNKGEVIYNLESNPTLDNCIFIFNGNLNHVDTREINRSGECIYNYDNNNMTLTNCTFIRNSGGNGIALRCNSYLYPSQVRLTNCILWNVGEEILNEDGSTIIVTYSNVQGGWEGEGNIDIDPLFVDPGYWVDANNPNIIAEPNDPNAVWIDGDYHLKSQAGRWDPNSQSWVMDDVNSPCIDAGDPNSPVGDEPEPNGGRINMGAYGGTAEASMSLTESITIYIQWLGHASVKVWTEDVVVYVDPWLLSESPHDATAVLVTHSHDDHYSRNDIISASNNDTVFIAPPDVIQLYGSGQTIAPEQTIQLDGFSVTGVAAYNINKPRHPKSNNWVGFIIELGGKRIYLAGDTDLTEEVKAVENIDVVFLPVSGGYAMSATEAAEATQYIQPQLAVPYHWGTFIGNTNDAQTFAEQAACTVKIMSAGEIINSDDWLE